MDRRDPTTRFVELLTSHQIDLFAYVNTLLVGSPDVDDIVQEATLDLWARKDKYDHERPFLPWAFAFAFQRVLAYRKTKQRSRIIFSDEFLNSISEAYMENASSASTLDVRLTALSNCVKKLDPKQQKLVYDRYFEKISMRALAERIGGNVNQVCVTMHRIRKALAKCVAAAVVKER